MSESYGKIKGISTGGGKSLDKSGFETSGYIDKKGTPSGEGAQFNKLPPGMDIEDQELFHGVGKFPYKSITPQGYAGDGWEG
jgi:hypothetical protein